MDILLIEDEQTIGKSVDRGLIESGHNCTWIRNGARGLEEAQTQSFDAIVLDLLLPDMDGWALLSKLRGVGIRTPVLILTALGSVENKVKGLELGADDYLVKPFAFPELIARLNAICRRTGDRPSIKLEAGPISLDMATRKVIREGVVIDLSPTEFSILEYLMRLSGQVVTRKMLNQHLWGDDGEGLTNVIDVHVNNIRKKLDRKFDRPLIHTVRGRGYVLRIN